MPATLKSSYGAYLRPFFCADQKGNLIVLYGNRRGLHWNGIESTAQNLGIDAPSAAPTVALDVGAGAATAGLYTFWYRFKDGDGNYSNFSPSATLTAAGSDGFDWTVVPDSTDTRVTHKELIRTTAAQATTGYVRTTIAQATTAFLNDYISDATLDDNTALPILTSDGFANANRFTPPPETKRCCVNVHDRFFYGVTTTYREGSIELTNGSTTVQGRGTNFTADMEDRILYIEGQTAKYTIDSVDTTNQTLTLTAVFAGTTNLFVDYYAIKETEDDAEKWYFSGVLEPESVIATDNFKIQWDDGDFDTAAFRLGYSFFISRSRNIYQVNIGANPRRDIDVNHIVNRGSVNPFTMTNVEKTMWMMDYKGLHVFTGGASQHLSEAIQDVFRGENSRYNINWQASDWFFVSHNPQEETVRFHVCMGGAYLPKWAICLHYRKEVGWFEYYPWRIGHACLADTPAGLELLYGSEGERVYRGNGTLDGPAENVGTLRGTVDSATLISITDNTAVFPASNVVNAPLCIVSGRGKGQYRIISAVSTQTITVKHPFSVLPDTTSVYVIGGVEWRWKSGLFKFTPRETSEVRRAKLAVEPTDKPGTIDIRTYYNHDKTPTEIQVPFDRQGTSSTGSPTIPVEDVVWDIQRNPTTDNPDQGDFTGFRDHNFDDGFEDETEGDRWVAIELRGFQGEDRIVLHELGIDGVRK